ncbi:MAG TPA: DUF192 domain-containing protein [Alphaproteobacteria bacterium]|nr:DUF192 domain-containing protein [Alphaproteobacteria bacterium]
MSGPRHFSGASGGEIRRHSSYGRKPPLALRGWPFLRTLKLLLPLMALGALLLAMPDLARAAELPKGPLVIKTADGVEHRFTVEVATTDAEREQGLMFRAAMAPDAGMLFDFKEAEPVAMWMKDTYLPLDMLFIARDGRIVHIAERTVPFSLTTISSGEPVLAVLELNSGTASRLKIKPGDRVIHPIFGN